MSADPLLETAQAVRDHHQPNEWDSCVACRKQWPCDAELLAELVVTRAAQPLASETTDAGPLYSTNLLYENDEPVEGLRVNGRKGTYRDLRDLIDRAALSSSGSIDAERLARAIRKVERENDLRDDTELGIKPMENPPPHWYEGYAETVAAEYARLSESVE